MHVCVSVLALASGRLILARPVARAASPAAAPNWTDQVLYFAIVDRFADGDSSNNVNVDRTSRGAFHGGDLKGLRAHLGEIADLGVTALWITPVVENIDGFVTGAGFPDWAYHGYWADDFTRLDRRFGSEQDLAALAQACDERGIKLLRRESIRAEGDLLVFARHDEASGDRVIVAVDRGDATAALDVSLPGAWAGAQVQDAWRDTPVVARDGGLVANVPGRQAAILVSRGGAAQMAGPPTRADYRDR